MDEPEKRTVPRPGSEAARAESETKKPAPIAWRKISLLATPLVLAMVNLIDAYADKQKAVIAGDKNYERLVGEGQEAMRVAGEEGKSVGQKRKAGIIAEARSHAAAVVVGSQKRAVLIVKQGDHADPLMKQQAEATMTVMRPIHESAEHLLRITKLSLLTHEGIDISTGTKLSEVEFVGRRKSSEAERDELFTRPRLNTPQFVKNMVNARESSGFTSHSLRCR